MTKTLYQMKQLKKRMNQRQIKKMMKRKLHCLKMLWSKSQVDGETQQVSLKSLKRLHGQEASLTRKSQEVAAKRKEAEEALGKADISYRKLLERAESRMKPYAEVDMLVASRQMSSEDFAAFRKEAKAAEDDPKVSKRGS